MNKLKTKILLLILVAIFAIPFTVKADDSIKMRTTRSGIQMPATDYQKLVNVYGEDYVEWLSQDLYDALIINIDNAVTETYEEVIPTKGTFFQSPSKTISITKNGNYISLIATWSKVPVTKTYDVIAVRLVGVSISGSVSFSQSYYSNGSSYLVSDAFHKSLSNGYGCSFKLRNGSNHLISMTFQVSGSGQVFGSYQHAAQATTLAESKKYTLSQTGYGRVISFYGGVETKYDNMTGVDITV